MGLAIQFGREFESHSRVGSEAARFQGGDHPPFQNSIQSAGSAVRNQVEDVLLPGFSPLITNGFNRRVSQTPGTTAGTYWLPGTVLVLGSAKNGKELRGIRDQTQLEASAHEHHSHAVIFLRRVGRGQS